MPRLLIIDGPDQALTRAKPVLEDAGLVVERTSSALDGIQIATSRYFDLILLELALPDGSGEHVLVSVLNEDPDVRVIVTARLEDVGRRVGALAMGAIDAIATPFVEVELLARVRARLRAPGADAEVGDAQDLDSNDLGGPVAEVHDLVASRRPRGGMPPAELRVADRSTMMFASRSPARSVAMHPRIDGATAFAYDDEIQLDTIRRCVVVRGRAVDLSQREFVLMSHLMSRRGQICSRRELLADVWGLDFEARTNVVDVYIRRLRLKLATITIDTVRNVGYRLNPT